MSYDRARPLHAPWQASQKPLLFFMDKIECLNLAGVHPKPACKPSPPRARHLDPSHIVNPPRHPFKTILIGKDAHGDYSALDHWLIPTCTSQEYMSSFHTSESQCLTKTVRNTGQGRGFSTTQSHGHTKPRSSSSIVQYLLAQLRDLLWLRTREPSLVVAIQPTKIIANGFY